MNRDIREKIDKELLRDQEHNYEIIETDDGFTVFPIEKRRAPVTAYLDKNGFWTITHPYNSYNVPMYDLFSLSYIIVSTLYEDWESPIFNPLEEGEEKYKILNEMPEDEYNAYQIKAIKYYKMRDWSIVQTKKSLAKRMKEIWNKKNNEIVAEDIRLLHKKLFSVSSGKGYNSVLRKILENKEKYEYLIKDLINYRAARALAANMSDSYFLENDWKDIFGVNTGAMRKTAMNLPGVPYFYASRFCETGRALPEPALTRIRFMAYAEAVRINDARWDGFSKVILRSTDEEIKTAIRMVWKYTNDVPKCGFKSTKYIDRALQFIYDYNDPIGKWNMIGLAKRCIQYHDDLANHRRDEEAERLKRLGIKLEQPTKLPPAPLPEIEEIKFLGTYGDVVEEGRKMGHCIASYADQAIRGQSFLFHVDYEGEMASVEVTPYGQVRQSHGPYNQSNKASKYGQKVLAQWARKFKPNNVVIENADYQLVAPNGNRLDVHPLDVRVYDYADDDIPF